MIRSWRRVRLVSWRGVGQLHTGAGASDGRGVFDAGRGCVFDFGPRDGGDGSCGAREVKVGEEVEIVGIKETTKTTCTGVEMFRKLLDEGLRGQHWRVVARCEARRH